MQIKNKSKIRKEGKKQKKGMKYHILRILSMNHTESVLYINHINMCIAESCTVVIIMHLPRPWESNVLINSFFKKKEIFKYMLIRKIS